MRRHPLAPYLIVVPYLIVALAVPSSAGADVHPPAKSGRQARQAAKELTRAGYVARAQRVDGTSGTQRGRQLVLDGKPGAARFELQRSSGFAPKADKRRATRLLQIAAKAEKHLVRWHLANGRPIEAATVAQRGLDAYATFGGDRPAGADYTYGLEEGYRYGLEEGQRSGRPFRNERQLRELFDKAVRRSLTMIKSGVVGDSPSRPTDVYYKLTPQNISRWLAVLEPDYMTTSDGRSMLGEARRQANAARKARRHADRSSM